MADVQFMTYPLAGGRQFYEIKNLGPGALVVEYGGSSMTMCKGAIIQLNVLEDTAPNVRSVATVEEVEE